jgi:predicted RNA-binding protein with PUA-like domain
MHYWLFKSEPNTFSIDDLSHRPKQTEPWNGVRNSLAKAIVFLLRR